MKPIIALILISLISGCTTTSDKYYEQKINKNVWELCKALNSSQPVSIEALLMPFGKPIESSVEEKLNKHIPNKKDYIKTYTYVGGKVVIYSVPHINRNYITTIILSEEYWPKHIKNYFGIRENSLNQIFGKADKITNNKVQYACSIESHDYIEFNIKNRKVNGVKIQAWVD